MKAKRRSYLWYILLLIIIFTLALLIPFWGAYEVNRPGGSLTERTLSLKFEKENQGFENLQFDLVDPGIAPLPLRQTVQQGYQIMLHTTKLLPDYAGDRLNCTNCHFAGGNTTGGKHNGISLVGVAAIYPRFDERSQRVIDLPTRINSCFERSMNGKALPLDSSEMLALVTYFQWISKDIPIYSKISWLGLPELTSKHIPDPTSGEQIYSAQCAMCHGKDGQGEIDSNIPPLWGEHAYNDAAGMNRLETMALFVHENMPYDEPRLSMEQSLDVAAFIGGQSRPHFDSSKQ